MQRGKRRALRVLAAGAIAGVAILGAKAPDLGQGNGKWRWFYAQQNGDNVTYEVLFDDRDDR
jgi:hypothetical protein